MAKANVHIRTFGCQMNKLDSDLLASALREAGMAITDSPAAADVVVINTCSVREHAEERVFSHLGHLKHLRKSRPGTIVAVMGCMAQRLGDELLAHPAVDIVCGPGQLPRLPAMIRSRLESQKTARTGDKAVAENIRRKPTTQENQTLDDFERTYDLPGENAHSQAFVRAMRGCNKFCTYCVVPYVRGPEVSRNPAKILEQISKLAESGIRQVTLLGQTINSYRFEDGKRTWRLADLLEEAAAIEGVHWLRFITSYPSDFDPRILRVMAENPKICPYLHIPAQSGSETILRAMNRRYTPSEYLAILDEARRTVPDIAIAGDFIVGFPSETDDDFAQTLDLLREARYKNAFIFKYSPRPGTHAVRKLADDIPSEVKKQRNIALLEAQNVISEEDNERFVGSTLEVLVEGISKKPHLDGESGEMPQLVGRTAHDYIVVFKGNPALAGTFAKVRILRSSALTLFGKLV